MDRHSLTRDELLASGALYVPPSWRKSLQAGCPKPKGQDRQRDLFSDLPDEEGPRPAELEALAEETEAKDGDEAADGLESA